MPALRRKAGTSLTTRPRRLTVPSVGSRKPATMLRVVVLPQPDGPSSERNSPRATSRLTPWSTGVDPYRIDTSRSWTSISTERGLSAPAGARLSAEDRGPALGPLAELLADDVVVRRQ